VPNLNSRLSRLPVPPLCGLAVARVGSVMDLPARPPARAAAAHAPLELAKDPALATPAAALGAAAAVAASSADQRGGLAGRGCGCWLCCRWWSSLGVCVALRWR